jgi:hexosaminidase
MRHNFCRAVLVLVVIAACRRGPAAPPVPDPVRISVVPAPVSLARGGGFFQLDSTSAIVVDAASDSALRVAEMLATQLRPPTGYALSIRQVSGTATPARGIKLRIDASRAADGEEGYGLVVAPDSVLLVSRTPTGLFRGIQTIRQLLPFGIEAENSVIKMGEWQIPSVTITDRPRFAWRGTMLDVSRHFFTVDEVKQHIDLLALYKISVLHLHLADDQGWRIEIKSRPQLVAQGSAMQVGGGPGGFYTQDEYSDIVRYAHERYITVVPEIDMPGHTNAMLISHPTLSCGREAPAPYTSIRVGFSALCPDSAGTWSLVGDIVREIAALTPGPYFHIGGDEVEELKGDQYARFVERAQEIVIRHGKRMVGWEEIYKARLQPTTLVQQWRSDSARNALSQGVKLILSPGKKMYLDMKYDRATELGLRWAGLIPLDTAYNWDPANYIAGVTESDIVGIEAPLWSETIRNITAAHYLAMPRLAAYAEMGWTPQAARRWEDFRQRIAVHAPRWRLMGVNYHRDPSVRWH